MGYRTGGPESLFGRLVPHPIEQSAERVFLKVKGLNLLKGWYG